MPAGKIWSEDELTMAVALVLSNVDDYLLISDRGCPSVTPEAHVELAQDFRSHDEYDRSIEACKKVFCSRRFWAHFHGLLAKKTAVAGDWGEIVADGRARIQQHLAEEWGTFISDSESGGLCWRALNPTASASKYRPAAEGGGDGEVATARPRGNAGGPPTPGKRTPAQGPGEVAFEGDRNALDDVQGDQGGEGGRESEGMSAAAKRRRRLASAPSSSLRKPRAEGLSLRPGLGRGTPSKVAKRSVTDTPRKAPSLTTQAVDAHEKDLPDSGSSNASSDGELESQEQSKSFLPLGGAGFRVISTDDAKFLGALSQFARDYFSQEKKADGKRTAPAKVKKA
jgi:hypothetical protein